MNKKAIISAYMAKIGRKGGKAGTGDAKRRGGKGVTRQPQSKQE